MKKAFIENKAVDETELDFILEYTLSAMIGIMSYWFRQDKVISAEKLIKLMYNLMENGVMPQLRIHEKRLLR